MITFAPGGANVTGRPVHGSGLNRGPDRTGPGKNRLGPDRQFSVRFGYEP